jgi:hypothetical protein
LLAYAAIIDTARLPAAQPALEQHNCRTALTQMQRRRAAGNASADDRDIRRDVPSHCGTTAIGIGFTGG